MPTKKPTGQFVWYDAAIEAHTVTSAMAADSPMASAGLSVNDRAAAGGRS